jgi:hypothetical protein
MSDFAPDRKAAIFIGTMCLVLVVTAPITIPILYLHERLCRGKMPKIEVLFASVALLLTSCGPKEGYVPFTPEMCAKMCEPLPVACFVPKYYTNGSRLLRGGGQTTYRFNYACTCGTGICSND